MSLFDLQVEFEQLRRLGRIVREELGPVMAARSITSKHRVPKTHSHQTPSSQKTLCWRGMDSNFQFRTRQIVVSRLRPSLGPIGLSAAESSGQSSASAKPKERFRRLEEPTRHRMKAPALSAGHHGWARVKAGAARHRA